MGDFLRNARRQHELTSALDLGCGVGYFSKHLFDLNFQVVAVDGREENVAEARARYPAITFVTRNAEDPRLPEIGSFDFVACIGLLYHLENPFRAIRNLHALTGKILLIETMCVPKAQATMYLLDEGIAEDQGLNYVAFYPSQSCLVKMLYRAGFPFVYRFQRLPLDRLYTASAWQKRQRTFLVASKSALTVDNIVLAKEPHWPVSGPSDPWATLLSRLKGQLFQLRVFLSRLAKPSRARADSASSRSGDVGVK
jgi:SAM-dependent methyltransferase